MNKGTTKIKAIAKRALEIREKAGFTTETITKKRYNVAYIPDAIKQAAKELKSGKAVPAKGNPFKKGDYVKIVGLEYATTKQTPINPFNGKYGIVQNYQRNDVDVTVYTNNGKSTSGFLESNLKKVTKSEFEKSQAKRKKRVLNTRAITKKATPAPVGAPLVMKVERARVLNKKFIRVSSKGKTFKQTYGISATELLKKSELDKYKIFSLTMLYEILTKRKSENINEVDFYGKLIQKLAKNGKYITNKKHRGFVNVEGFEFDIVERMPAKVKPGMFGLTNICKADKLRPNYSGVFVDDDVIVATDGHKLTVIKDKENLKAKYNHQIIGIHKSNFKQVMDGIYPKYMSVLPKMEDQKEVTGWIVIDDILPQINGNAIILKSLDHIPGFMILNFNGSKIGVNAENLMHLLNALKCNGAKKVKIGMRDATRGILFISDNDNIGLTMPMLVNGIEDTEKYMFKQLKLK